MKYNFLSFLMIIAHSICSMDRVQPKSSANKWLVRSFATYSSIAQGCTSKRLIFAESKPGGLFTEASYVQDWPRIAETVGREQLKG